MTATLQETITSPITAKQPHTLQTILILDAAAQPLRVTPPPSMLMGSEIEVVQKSFYDVRDALRMIGELSAPPLAIIGNYVLLRQFSFYFSQQIRQNAQLQRIPIIAVSDNTESLDLQTAMKSGIDDCYTQPIRWEMMEKRIDFLQKFRPQIERAAEAKDHIDVYASEKLTFGKRAFDIVVASTALIVASPIMLLTAAMIKLESGGKVFYSQKRAGRNYQVFDFWKFRSMYENADQRIAEMQKLNQYKNNGNGPQFLKVKNDPRITRVGRVIRKYSIDELPQLVNVLSGEMSIVGNRPLPLYEAKMLTKDQYSERFDASAGLTGLWQVSKRGSDDMSAEERIGLDITYARKNNLLYDFMLLVKTARAFVQKENV